MLARGGSALDAAIAVQLVLGLVEPESSGIGGGAFLLHWSEKERTLRSYDGRETAPAAARPDRFLNPERKPLRFHGGRGRRPLGRRSRRARACSSSPIASTAASPWRELFEPAIRIAEAGFDVSPRLRARARAGSGSCATTPRHERSTTRTDRSARESSTRAYARDAAQAGARTARRRSIGARSRRTSCAQCARTRRRPQRCRISRPTARVEREPVCAPYRRYRVCSMGPPSAGRRRGAADPRHAGSERVSTERRRARPQAVHLFAEAGRLAYADRARYGGDPDFVPVPVEDAC